MTSPPEQSQPAARPALVAVDFAALPGWGDDDHLAALTAFARSCGRLHATGEVEAGKDPRLSALLDACAEALRLLAGDAGETTSAEARGFFEAHFTPHRIVHEEPQGLLTGYYEPVIEGSRSPAPDFPVPALKRPADLVNLVAESERGAKADRLTHARRTDDGVVAYATRREIDEGALAGQGLELVWLRDAVELFFMQVQGSGRIALADGGSMRVTYDGKNGHPYTSIGRYLIEQGLFTADSMTLPALKHWLRSNPERMRDVLWQNQSYVFFRELTGEEADGPLGVLGIPLSTGRSLAVDTAHHAIGTPVYVSAPGLTHVTGNGSCFHRLMIAQDVGSAIRGPERGDIYFGSGPEAGELAGITKHRGNFFVLLPKPVRGGEPDSSADTLRRRASP